MDDEQDDETRDEQDDETRDERSQEPQPDQATEDRRDVPQDDDLPALHPEPGITAPLDHVTEEESAMEPVVVMPGAGPDHAEEPSGDAGEETGAAEEPNAGGEPETSGTDEPGDGEGTRR